MKTIGMIVAVEIESVLSDLGSKLREETISGYRSLEYNTNKYKLIIVDCGPGEIASSGATQFLIDKFNVDLIVNFGLVGGLTDETYENRLCLVKNVVHYDFDLSQIDNVIPCKYPNYNDIYIPTTSELIDKALELNNDLIVVNCASGDKFIASSVKKRELSEKLNCQICEMEAAGIVLTCNRNNIPCLLIKVVSDNLNGGADQYLELKNSASIICFRTIDYILNEL